MSGDTRQTSIMFVKHVSVTGLYTVEKLLN